MKKKIIIVSIAVVLVIAIVFGVIFAVNSIKRKAISEYAGLASDYFELAKNGNNQLMDVAGTYGDFSVGFSFEDAQTHVEETLGLYKGVSFDVDVAYGKVMGVEIKYDEMQEIKDVVAKHYVEYKRFENRVLNESEKNYNESYKSLYKSWQVPFADEHNSLRNILAKYR